MKKAAWMPGVAGMLTGMGPVAAADGKAVYEKICAGCHSAMMPKAGDKAVYGPAFAQECMQYLSGKPRCCRRLLKGRCLSQFVKQVRDKARTSRALELPSSPRRAQAHPWLCLRQKLVNSAARSTVELSRTFPMGILIGFRYLLAPLFVKLLCTAGSWRPADAIPLPIQ
jgi:hypothetical protein